MVYPPPRLGLLCSATEPYGLSALARQRLPDTLTCLAAPLALRPGFLWFQAVLCLSDALLRPPCQLPPASWLDVPPPLLVSIPCGACFLSSNQLWLCLIYLCQSGTWTPS
eukprot:GGOE01047202.1.p5 GENE.GGOE01047202.1~~GGOE01047202.1.p5  ORF type:complete len:110 (-),score=0.08 GGOE01047202.1:700-1029(-)